VDQQPDVKLYGRIFSWAFIFLANVALVLVWLAVTTSLTFAALGGLLASRLVSAYVGTGLFLFKGARWLARFVAGFFSHGEGA